METVDPVARLVGQAVVRGTHVREQRVASDRRPVEQAEQLLTFSNKKAAHIVKKVLLSAIANAEHNEGADIDELKIATIMVDEGPTFKRGRARAKGRGTRILKRNSHITVTVADENTGQA